MVQRVGGEGDGETVGGNFEIGQRASRIWKFRMSDHRREGFGGWKRRAKDREKGRGGAGVAGRDWYQYRWSNGRSVTMTIRVGRRRTGPGWRRAGATLTGGRESGGLRGMDDEEGKFPELVAAVLARFFAQNARMAPADTVGWALGARLEALVAARGWPRALRDDERGAPGGMPAEECATMVARVLDGANDELLVTAVKQLVKACGHPEFRNCRDSFREVAPDGMCRRQQVERARGRISGSHCVDCPHWVGLAPAAHREFLAGEWRGEPAELAANRDIFLPEDFRALQQWLRAAARRFR